MRPPRGGVLAAALLVGLLVAGCGSDDPDAGGQPTVSVTPSASPSPTVDIPDVPVPVLPDEAKEYTSDGAIAFVHYAVEVVNRAYVTGDTESPLALGTPECPTCRRAAEDIDAVYGRRNAYRGGEVSLVQADWAALGENVVPTVPSVVDIALLEEVAPDGTVVESFPAESGQTMLWDLDWNDGKWRLADVRGPKDS